MTPTRTLATLFAVVLISASAARADWTGTLKITVDPPMEHGGNMGGTISGQGSMMRVDSVQQPQVGKVTMIIDVKARKPTVDWPPLRIVRFSGTALRFGVVEHRLEGVAVNITSKEKTVADCFKYRNKIGIDVALEALRDYLRAKGRSVDALMEAAAASRVTNVMRPYLEALA